MKRLWEKYKEYILYLFFGGITSLVNYGVYVLCLRVFSFGVVPSNIIAWVLAVTVAFITNKIWVFESKSKEGRVVLKELWEFFLGRFVTLAIETLLLWIFVDLLHVNALIMKVITSVIVVVLNYIFSKFIIFKKQGGANPSGPEQKEGSDE